MADNIKGGKKPLSAKPTEFNLGDEFHENRLAIDPTIRKEIEDAGLEMRFVDAKSLYEMNGYHKDGWVPYIRKVTSGDKIDSNQFKFGNDPSGVIRRGTLILAVKTKEQADMHRERNRQKAARYQFEAAKATLDGIKNTVRQGNLGKAINVGYDGDDE